MIFLDGGMGTMLQARGLGVGQDPCDWNIEHPDKVIEVHRAYVAAGSNVLLSNTFGANALKYHGRHDLPSVIRAGVKLAKEAASGRAKVALDLGPTGRMLAPAGDLAFDDACRAFAETIRIGVDAGADLIFIETISDTRELKAAIVAAKENSSLPIWVTVTLGEDGRLLTGATPEATALLLEGLKVDAYGFNCGLGPDRMTDYVRRLAAISTRPIIVKPNAGMPHLVNGCTVFDVAPADFATQTAELVKLGASVVGGCCGTTPEHIAAVAGLIAAQKITPATHENPPKAIITGGASMLELDGASGLIIGERINPTGKKKLKEAYRNGDTAFILREAMAQIEAGADALDVNTGVPGIDETAVLTATVEAVQSVATCPLQIDTGDAAALKSSMRIYDGVPLVNSVNGSAASMAAVFPVVQRYGGLVVGLCLDENGIPETAEGRIAVARRILENGAKYGLPKSAFLFDALTLAVSSDPNAAKITLETVRRLTEELGVKTVLGVSNVSFGLPNRPALNNAMFALAKRVGLTAAIANPSLIRDEIVDGAEDVLLGRDIACASWIARSQVETEKAAAAAAELPAESDDVLGVLRHTVIRGLRDDASLAAGKSLARFSPVETIDGAIVPALEEVGRGFETGKLYLPQLLMSAEAASAAFAVIKAQLAAGNQQRAKTPRVIVVATVKGDVHDIGKNIVRALLENYGFDVIDLGRDVPPETVVRTAVENKCRLVGLSALMTTTVGAMRETIRQLAEVDPQIKTFVGGAVVTEEFAKEIGATWYTKDAMASVRLAKEFFAQ